MLLDDSLTGQSEFEQARPALFALAYRMLGTRADAEDVVQEAWLRWQSAAKEDIRMPKSFLMTVVARLSLDALKSAQHKRETYVGPWLPEPLIQPAGTQHIEMAETLSIAFLHILESLSPAERVAFLMREAFDAEYEEIALALDTSEANSRQLFARAKKHIDQRRPRFEVDRTRHQRMLQQFLTACASGDASQFTNLLSEDVVLYSDGGGKQPAALNPIYGPDRVARLMVGLAQKIGTDYEVRFAEVNGEPGALLTDPRGIVTVVTVEVSADERLSHVFLMRNPDKLTTAPDAREWR
jgi:RNA polymerase sigma-70 factor (ECF subfamily)